MFSQLRLSPQSLVEEQQSQLNQYECAAGQCVSELQKAQLQVQSLQTKIHESEANNMVRRRDGTSPHLVRLTAARLTAAEPALIRRSCRRS